jgi:HK97 family phage major capsid protein
MPKNLATPNEGESREDFIARCQEEGGDEESCAADWDAANPPASEGASAGLSLKQLAEQKRKLIAENRRIIDQADKEKRPLTGEEAQEYDRREADVEKLDAQINGLADHETRRQRLAVLEDSLKRPLPRQTSSSQPAGRCGCDGAALSFSLGKHRQPLLILPGSPLYALASAKYLNAFNSFARGERRNWESLGLKVADDSKGGYLAPMSWVAMLIKFLDDEVFVRQLATVLPPTTSKSVGAVSYDTDLDDGTWTPEVPASDVSEDDAMRFGGRELAPHLIAKLVKTSLKLARSSSINIDSFVAERFGYKFGVTEEKAFLTGDGVEKPLGAFTESANGITTTQNVATSSTTDFTADDLVNCLYDLKDAYVAKATWVGSREFRRRCRKLKDGEGRWMLIENQNGGMLTTLLERPLKVSEFAPATFTAAKPIAVVGDWSNYWIQDGLNLEIQNLLELFALKNQIGWIARKETDGMPVLAEAFRRFKTKA